MANIQLINNLKFITDKALKDLEQGYNDPNVEQTMGSYIQSGAISTGGQSYEKTLQEAVTYYKYIKGEVSMGGVNSSDPLLSNMKILSDKAIADRKNGYNDPNIQETIRQMVRSGQIQTGGQTEEKTVQDAVNYYTYIKGNSKASSTTTTNNTQNTTTSTQNNVTNSNGSTTSSTQNNIQTNTTNQSTTSINNSITFKDTGIPGIISAINECTKDIEILLNNIKNNEINTINNSWVANEASSYVEKVNQATDKMNRINQALNLLATTYDKALKMNEETSKQVNNYVNNMQ